MGQETARVLVEGHATWVRELKLPRLFSKGSKLSAVRVGGKNAVVRVIPGGPEPSHPLAVQALAHTLVQFEGIGAVTLNVRGRTPSGPEAPRAGVVEAPPPPRLLDVLSPIHKGEKPSEIDVLFDRPVDVEAVSVARRGKALPRKNVHVDVRHGRGSSARTIRG